MPPKIKTQAFLATLPLFKELAPAELDRLAASTNELHVPRGEILFNKGDPTTGFYLVIYGQVKLSFVTPSGQEKVVPCAATGASFRSASRPACCGMVKMCSPFTHGPRPGTRAWFMISCASNGSSPLSRRNEIRSRTASPS